MLKKRLSEWGPIILCLLVCAGLLFYAARQPYEVTIYRQDDSELASLTEEDSQEQAKQEIEEGEKQVCVNTATVSELMLVPDMREVMANRIYFSRLREGDFESMEDLMRVQGMEESFLKKIQPYLSLTE